MRWRMYRWINSEFQMLVCGVIDPFEFFYSRWWLPGEPGVSRDRKKWG